jgi:hypothetical protein
MKFNKVKKLIITQPGTISNQPQIHPKFTLCHAAGALSQGIHPPTTGCQLRAVRLGGGWGGGRRMKHGEQDISWKAVLIAAAGAGEGGGEGREE